MEYTTEIYDHAKTTIPIIAGIAGTLLQGAMVVGAQWYLNRGHKDETSNQSDLERKVIAQKGVHKDREY